MTEAEQIDRIRAHREALGKRLVILGHHYQRETIVRLSDFVGDSYALSAKAASQGDAESIVFCGVHFMAESARILASAHQRIFMPDVSAGCPMADMAFIEDVESAWKMITETLGPGSVIPVTYMNSSAELKAFCGVHGGAVCTSSNAKKVFKWALDIGKKIFFFPDEHLGRNTANTLSIPREQRILWDRNLPGGGVDEEGIERGTLFLWKGFCFVHTHFTLDHVREARKKYPDGRIIVHPECREEIVKEVDATGSTSYICKYTEDSPPGSTVIIGTEINLVSRLANENPDKTIIPLSRSLCNNMFLINPAKLLYTLDNLGKVNEIFVDQEITEGARLALNRMLKLA